VISSLNEAGVDYIVVGGVALLTRIIHEASTAAEHPGISALRSEKTSMTKWSNAIQSRL
jgi:hypothetical protein